MKKHVKKARNYFKNNKVMLVVAVMTLALGIGMLAYNQSSQSALQRKQQESDSKLASQIQESKKLSEARKAKIAAEKKAAEEAAAKKAAEEKAAVEAEAKRQAEEEAAKAIARQKAAANAINLSAGAPIPKEGTGYYKIPVSWSSGFHSEKGFKLVWNTSGYPVYPGSEYHYSGESSSSGSGYIKVTPGTYYIRVCEYLGGSCGRYSNQVMVNVP